MTTDPKHSPVVDEDELTEAEGPGAAEEQQPQEPDAATDAAPEAPEAEPAPELDPVAAKAAQADQYLALAQRTRADFENYRKRTMREADAAQSRGVIKLAK